MRENRRKIQAEFDKVHEALACQKRKAKDKVPIVVVEVENEFKKHKKRNARYTLCSEEKIPLLSCNVVKKPAKKARLRVVQLKKGKRKVRIPKLRHSLRVSRARIVSYRKLQKHFALLHTSRFLQKMGIPAYPILAKRANDTQYRNYRRKPFQKGAVNTCIT